MKISTANLVLAPDAPVDLQTHTLYSDGVWTPEGLIDHALQEQFGLIAITDHDRVDTVASVQALAIEKRLPVLAAVEMTTTWRGEMTDVLCYGFDPQQNELNALAQDVLRRQQANTRQVFEYLGQNGYRFAGRPEGETETVDELQAILDKPSAQHPHALVALLKRYGYGTGELSPGKILRGAGVDFITSDIAAVVEAAHRSGAVCLIAHPGRGDGFPRFDVPLLDQLRQDVPIDGVEAYYPVHTPEQTAMFLDYTQRHRLLVSSGSDSHGPDGAPIKYRAELSRDLLERVGIQVR
jgi:predicted metal-dependent phosphoesterase TrpH